jgi:hypothetical protein
MEITLTYDYSVRRPKMATVTYSEMKTVNKLVDNIHNISKLLHNMGTNSMIDVDTIELYHDEFAFYVPVEDVVDFLIDQRQKFSTELSRYGIILDLDLDEDVP